MADDMKGKGGPSKEKGEGWVNVIRSHERCLYGNH